METIKVNGWTEHDDVDPLIPLKELGFKTDEEQIECKPMPIIRTDHTNKESIGGDKNNEL